MESEKKAQRPREYKALRSEDLADETGSDYTSDSDGRSECSPESANPHSEKGEAFSFPFDETMAPSSQWNTIETYLDPKYITLESRPQSADIPDFAENSE